MQLTFQVDWGDLDVLVVDFPPGMLVSTLLFLKINKIVGNRNWRRALDADANGVLLVSGLLSWSLCLFCCLCSSSCSPLCSLPVFSVIAENAYRLPSFLFCSLASLSFQRVRCCLHAQRFGTRQCCQGIFVDCPDLCCISFFSVRVDECDPSITQGLNMFKKVDVPIYGERIFFVGFVFLSKTFQE